METMKLKDIYKKANQKILDYSRAKKSSENDGTNIQLFLVYT